MGMGNPLMMMMLLGDGGLGGGSGGMNSLLPLLLLGDSDYTPKTTVELTAVCSTISDLTALTACNGLVTTYAAEVATCTAMTDASAQTTCLAATKATELQIMAAAG